MSKEKPLIRRNCRWAGGARQFFLDRLGVELRKLARERASRVASMADADELRRKLGQRYVELSFPEGDLFCCAWWERCARGWRLRSSRLEVRA